MKQLAISFIFLSFAFTLQPDVQKKAQQAVSKYLKSMLPDAGMYQPIRWGKVDKVMTTYEMSAYYKFGVQLLDQKKNQLSEVISFAVDATNDEKKSEYTEEATKMKAEINKSEKELQDFRIKYKPIQFGWKIYHQFKAPNGRNIITEFGKLYYMDKTFNIVDMDTVIAPLK